MGEEPIRFWKRIASLVHRAMEPWRGSAHPMELRQAILVDLERDILGVGQGKKIYPYTHLRVLLLAETKRERAILEASFGQGLELAVAIRRHLAERGCPITELAVEVAVTGERREGFGEDRFLIEKERQPEQTPPASPRPSVVELTLVKGTADKEVYTFDQDRILIGRPREVMDEHGRLRRYNDLAFTENDEESRSVSREQACIERRDGEIRIIDERSAGGTQIFRRGRSIAVSSRDRRGILLQPGDVIVFGRAAVRFELREIVPNSSAEAP